MYVPMKHPGMPVPQSTLSMQSVGKWAFGPQCAPIQIRMQGKTSTTRPKGATVAHSVATIGQDTTTKLTTTKERVSEVTTQKKHEEEHLFFDVLHTAETRSEALADMAK